MNVPRPVPQPCQIRHENRHFEGAVRIVDSGAYKPGSWEYDNSYTHWVTFVDTVTGWEASYVFKAGEWTLGSN